MFKPGDKVRRIGGTCFSRVNGRSLAVIEGDIYTVKECISNSLITLVGKGSFTYGPENFELMEEGKMSECTCNKKTPHVHAELIKAWADGAIIQFEYHCGEWKDTFRNSPQWDVRTNYRIKPEPNPDVVLWGVVDSVGMYYVGECRGDDDNLRLTFDGETGKLKSAEIIA